MWNESERLGSLIPLGVFGEKVNNHSASLALLCHTAPENGIAKKQEDFSSD
jgi:hypothetical protein